MPSVEVPHFTLDMRPSEPYEIQGREGSGLAQIAVLSPAPDSLDILAHAQISQKTSIVPLFKLPEEAAWVMQIASQISPQEGSAAKENAREALQRTIGNVLVIMNCFENAEEALDYLYTHNTQDQSYAL